MTTTVAKEFKTVNRKFKPGDFVCEADLDGSALDWKHMKAKGFVSVEKEWAQNQIKVSKSKESVSI